MARTGAVVGGGGAVVATTASSSSAVAAAAAAAEVKQYRSHTHRAGRRVPWHRQGQARAEVERRVGRGEGREQRGRERARAIGVIWPAGWLVGRAGRAILRGGSVAVASGSSVWAMTLELS